MVFFDLVVDSGFFFYVDFLYFQKCLGDFGGGLMDLFVNLGKEIKKKNVKFVLFYSVEG